MLVEIEDLMRIKQVLFIFFIKKRIFCGLYFFGTRIFT